MPARTQLDDCLSIRDGHLFVEECDAVELAQRFGTPLSVVSEDQLRRNARAFVAAFGDAWPEGPVRILPSIKANFTLALRRVLTEEGLGCDAFGASELEAAVRSRVPPELISLNGSVKGVSLLERAVSLGIRITLDSVAELRRVQEIARRAGAVAQVRFRLRPDLTSLAAPSDLFDGTVPIGRATQLYKPGIATDVLVDAGRAAVEAPELDVTGVMVHVGRHGTDPDIWRALARETVAIVARLRDAWNGWEPRELDLGGGFPMPRDPTGRALEHRRADSGSAPAPPTYAAALAETLREELSAAGIDSAGLALEVEPGRALYGDAGIHFKIVLNVKNQSTPASLAWAETDTSEIFLPDLVFEHSRFPLIVASRADEAATETIEVVGSSCNFDVLAPGAQVPTLSAGDLLAFLDTGAYQDAGASNFNALPRPATVLVRGEEAGVVKRAETLEDVFARDVVPARLAGSAREGFRRLDHVSVTAGDLERSLSFYRDLLGIPLLDQGSSDAPYLARITGLEGAHVRWADLDLGGGQVLELLEYVSPHFRPRPTELSEPGPAHFSLAVADADAVHERLTRAGIAVRSEPVMIDEEGDWLGVSCFYAVDPDGFIIELVQRPS
jgi:diaminopimelate decarboxylase